MEDYKDLEEYLADLYSSYLEEYNNDKIEEVNIRKFETSKFFYQYKDINNIIKILNNTKFDNSIITSYIIDKYKYNINPTDDIYERLFSSDFIRSKYFIWLLHKQEKIFFLMMNIKS
jgi:hypothetical protein